MADAGRQAETEVLPLLVAVVACTAVVVVPVQQCSCVMAIKMLYCRCMQSPVDGLSPFSLA